MQKIGESESVSTTVTTTATATSTATATTRTAPQTTFSTSTTSSSTAISNSRRLALQAAIVQRRLSQPLISSRDVAQVKTGVQPFPGLKRQLSLRGEAPKRSDSISNVPEQELQVIRKLRWKPTPQSEPYPEYSVWIRKEDVTKDIRRKKLDEIALKRNFHRVIAPKLLRKGTPIAKSSSTAEDLTNSILTASRFQSALVLMKVMHWDGGKKEENLQNFQLSLLKDLGEVVRTCRLLFSSTQQFSQQQRNHQKLISQFEAAATLSHASIMKDLRLTSSEMKLIERRQKQNLKIASADSFLFSISRDELAILAVNAIVGLESFFRLHRAIVYPMSPLLILYTVYFEDLSLKEGSQLAALCQALLWAGNFLNKTCEPAFDALSSIEEIARYRSIKSERVNLLSCVYGSLSSSSNVAEFVFRLKSAFCEKGSFDIRLIEVGVTELGRQVNDLVAIFPSFRSLINSEIAPSFAALTKELREEVQTITRAIDLLHRSKRVLCSLLGSPLSSDLNDHVRQLLALTRAFIFLEKGSGPCCQYQSVCWTNLNKANSALHSILTIVDPLPQPNTLSTRNSDVSRTWVITRSKCEVTLDPNPQAQSKPQTVHISNEQKEGGGELAKNTNLNLHLNLKLIYPSSSLANLQNALSRLWLCIVAVVNEWVGVFRFDRAKEEKKPCHTVKSTINYGTGTTTDLGEPGKRSHLQPVHLQQWQ